MKYIILFITALLVVLLFIFFAGSLLLNWYDVKQAQTVSCSKFEAIEGN